MLHGVHIWYSTGIDWEVAGLGSRQIRMLIGRRSYKLIMKKQFVFNLEYTINQKSGKPCYLNVCSMQK